MKTKNHSIQKILENCKEVDSKFFEENITDFHEYSSDPKLYEFMSELTAHYGLSDTKRYFDKLIKDKTVHLFPILQKKKVVGTVSLRQLNKLRGNFHIGFASSSSSWGLPVVALTIASVIWLSFEKYKARRLEGLTQINNLRSQKLMENLGFKEEGLMKSYYKNKLNGDYIDAKIYNLFKHEFSLLKKFEI